MEVFRTHPSVRVKGTEDNYEPIACNIVNCTKRNVHLHCPFCVKSDSFYDPVILKAHYRVKHVDKGIEFAGLKILRCCDHCMIVGSIKGSKEFKGAHWHCYNCRNGFNRRDEALKHYKTHFRNPMTTFQIQITHDINQMMELSQVSMIDTETQNQSMEGQQTLTSTIGEDGRVLTGTQAMPWIVSSETVVSSVAQYDGGETKTNGPLVLTQDGAGDHPDSISTQNIQVCGEGIEDAQYYIVGEDGQLTATDGSQLTVTTTADQEVSEDSTVTDWETDRQQLLCKLAEMEQKYHNVLAEKKRSEEYFKQKIIKLEVEVQVNQKKIVALQQREHELLTQLELMKDGTHVSNILNEMKSKQEELLDQYMSKLKKTVTPCIDDSSNGGGNKHRVIYLKSEQNGIVDGSIDHLETHDSSQGHVSKQFNTIVSGAVPNNNGDVTSLTTIMEGIKTELKSNTNDKNVKSNINASTNKTTQSLAETNYVIPIQNCSNHTSKEGIVSVSKCRSVTVSAPSSIATKLPLSRYFTGTDGSVQNNLNLITTESGTQYVLVVDDEAGEHDQYELQEQFPTLEDVSFQNDTSSTSQGNNLEIMNSGEIALGDNVSEEVTLTEVANEDMEEQNSLTEVLQSVNNQRNEASVNSDMVYHITGGGENDINNVLNSRTLSDPIVSRSDAITGEADIAKNEDVYVNYVSIEHGYVSTDLNSSKIKNSSSINSTEQDDSAMTNVSVFTQKLNSDNCNKEEKNGQRTSIGNGSIIEDSTCETLIEVDHVPEHVTIKSEPIQAVTNITLHPSVDKRKAPTTPEISPSSLSTRPKRQRRSVVRDF